MSHPNPEQILENLLSAAQKHGASAAEAVFQEADGVSLNVRLGEKETVERQAEKALGLRVFVGRKTTSLSTSDLSENAISTLAEKAVQIAKKSPENRFLDLAEKGLFTETIATGLDIYDDTAPTVETLAEMALAAEGAGRAEAGITNSEGASAGWKKSTKIHLTSNGFFGRYRSSTFSLYAVLLAGEGTAMERDYDFTSSRFFSDLEAPKKIGKTAARRALRRLSPRKVKSGSVPVIFHRRVSGSLLGHFASAINGKPVAKGTTFLAGKMAQPVFSKSVNIIDDPGLKRGLASRPFDGEGLAMEALKVIENGVLKSWLLDIASGAEMGLVSNGRASRALTAASSPAATNLYMENGQMTLKELMKEAGRGLLVTDLIGMGVNGVTGDYSRGASGFWFEGGEIAFPVSEITIAGNLKNMFKDLIPAADLEFRKTINAPSLLIPAIMVAGT